MHDKHLIGLCLLSGRLIGKYSDNFVKKLIK